MIDERGEPTDAYWLDRAEHDAHAEPADIEPAEHDERAIRTRQWEWLAAGMVRLYLSEIRTVDQTDPVDYSRRYHLVLCAMQFACAAGFPVGIRLDPLQPEWPLVYIELPTGQVSWHMPQHERDWDGHSTEEKYARVQAYLDLDDDAMGIWGSG